MINLVQSCLKAEDITAILRKQHLKRELNFYTIDYLTINGTYKSLQLIFNEAHIFTKKHVYLSQSKSQLVGQIKSSIETYSSKEEYIENRPSLYDEQFIQNFIKFTEDKISDLVMNVSNESFKVRSVYFGWSPVCSIIIHYNLNKVRQEPLVLLPNNKTYIPNRYEGKIKNDYVQFIEDIFDERWEHLWI